MAQFTTSNAVGEREDLSDVITRIDPDETPIFSALKKETGNAVHVEWQVQELAAASATNYQNEGADATYDTPTTCKSARKTLKSLALWMLLTKLVVTVRPPIRKF
jgi:hypothetical protein